MILLFKFVETLQTFSYFIKMHFISVLSHSYTVPFSSFYFLHTHSHHSQLSVIFITMAELFLSPNLSHKTQPSRTRTISNTRPTSSALRIWAEIHPLNNPISRCNHHSILPRPMCGAVTAAADGDPQLRSSLEPDHPDGMQEVAFFASAS